MSNWNWWLTNAYSLACCLLLFSLSSCKIGFWKSLKFFKFFQIFFVQNVRNKVRTETNPTLICGFSFSKTNSRKKNLFRQIWKRFIWKLLAFRGFYGEEHFKDFGRLKKFWHQSISLILMVSSSSTKLPLCSTANWLIIQILPSLPPEVENSEYSKSYNYCCFNIVNLWKLDPNNI
jgi:hypothetical protein